MSDDRGPAMTSQLRGGGMGEVIGYVSAKNLAVFQANGQSELLTIRMIPLENDVPIFLAPPGAEANARVVELEIIEANSLLRSAHSIAIRKGTETNWDAWIARLHEALQRQLPIVNALTLENRND